MRKELTSHFLWRINHCRFISITHSRSFVLLFFDGCTIPIGSPELILTSVSVDWFREIERHGVGGRDTRKEGNELGRIPWMDGRYYFMIFYQFIPDQVEDGKYIYT
jgi:hypothetical protein